MEELWSSSSIADMERLRFDIKRRYADYHTYDRDRYPLFEFNSNRANYQPLRDSFEEEFYVIRKVNRQVNRLHIPSLNTLTRIFNDPGYVPSQKILNTCRSYGRGTHPLTLPTIAPNDPISTKRTERSKLTLIMVAGLCFFLTGLTLYWRLTDTTATELAILHPTDKQVVSQSLTVEGRVNNADIVWVVVHPVLKNRKYYVQDPIKVDKDGTWRGQVFVGTADHTSDGFAFDIKAYVKPGGSYKAIVERERYEYDTWPEEAELATEPIRVIRGTWHEEPED